MDLVTVATLSLFGAALVGGLVGWLIGSLTRFGFGLATGLLIYGGVVLWFAGRCLIEYQVFAHPGPNGVWGEVVAIEDKAVDGSGSVTQPVPVIRFTAPDSTVHTIHGPRAGSMKVGEHVNVIYDPSDPQRSRAGQISQLRGGAIAMMLFGTFPFSFGLWMLYSTFAGETDPQRSRSKARERPSAPRIQARANRMANALFLLLLFGALLWIGYGTGTLEQRFVHGFGAVAGVLLCYALWGAMAVAAGPVWSLGMAILALNFGVWAFALHLLL